MRRTIEAAALVLVEMLLLEAQRQYYYEEDEQKRWILGDGGRSGNCEYCVDNADRGWIDMDDVFDSPDGFIDDVPCHPHCSCTVEFKTRRHRVYA